MVVAGPQFPIPQTCATETTHQRPVVKAQWRNRHSSRSRYYWLRGLWLAHSVSDRGSKGRVALREPWKVPGTGRLSVWFYPGSIHPSSGSPTPWLAPLVLAPQAPVFSVQALDWPRTEPPPNHRCKALVWGCQQKAAPLLLLTLPSNFHLQRSTSFSFFAPFNQHAQLTSFAT